MSKRPSIPTSVARALRQEAYFGCAQCGNPIIEYHHIIPWEEEKHFRPEDMIALCPTCHSIAPYRPRENYYFLKKSPYNKENNFIHGMLGTTQNKPGFRVGGNTYIDTPVVLRYFQMPLIEYRNIDSMPSVSVLSIGLDGFPEVKIVNNEVSIFYNDFWDIIFKPSYLKIQKKRGNIYLELDLRPETPTFRASLGIAQKIIELEQSETRIGGTTWSNSTFIRCSEGIRIGDDSSKFFLANFAMLNPAAHIIRMR